MSQENDVAGQLLTVREVADRLRTSERTVYLWIKNGLLPRPARIGRRYLFKRADLDALLILSVLDGTAAPMDDKERAAFVQQLTVQMDARGFGKE